jgi:predicted outer membrane repeat protein
MLKRSLYILSILFITNFLKLDAQTFVNQTATGNNDGSSWVNAYTDLHNALFNTTSGEIWVAKGTYVPSKSFTGNIPGNNSQKTFRVKNNVQVYGGFNGDETSLSQRDWVANPTILSGNMGGGVFAFNTVRFDGNDNTTLLDGFTVRDGKAVGTGSTEQTGGAIYIANGSKPTIRNCKFINNNAQQHGGAIYGIGGAVKVEKCIFESNTTNQYDAGAVYLTNADSNVVVNCLFNGNTAARYAGAIVVQNTPISRIINCTFVKNTRGAGGSGKCIFLSSSTGNPQLQIVNCIFSNNFPGLGNDVSRNNTSGYSVSNSFCDAGNAGFTFASSLTNISSGLIKFNNSEQNDFSLQCSSPAVNSGLSNALYIGSTDLLGNPRIFGGTVDLGALENNVSQIGIIANKTSICSGESVTLKGTCDPVGYSWSDGVINGVAFYPTVTTTYTCTGLSNNDIEQITINVVQYNDESITYTPFACSGSTTVSISGSVAGGNYFLIDTTTNIIADGPVTGTGGPINFSVNGLTETKTFKVLGGKSSSVIDAPGTALDFDGVNDKVITDFKFNTTNTFTIEGWIYPRANSFRRIISNYTTGVGQIGEIVLDTYNSINNGRGLRLYMLNNTNATQVSVANVLTLNAWNHVAATFDNGSIKLYVNGTLAGSGNSNVTNFGSTSANAAYSFGEETVTGSTSEFFNGKIDEFRFWNKALSESEISNNISNCVTGNESGLLAYFKFDKINGTTITDIVGGFTGTLDSMDPANDWVSGNNSKCEKIVASIEPYGKALDLDGTNDRISTSFGITNSKPKFSIESWLYPRSINYDRIISNHNGAGTVGNDVLIFDTFDQLNNGKGLRLMIGSNTLTATNVLTLNAWNHVAAVFDNGTMSLYVNGFEVATGSANINAISSSNAKFYIGEDNAGADNENLNAKIDEVRFWNKALSQSDIMNNMNKCLSGSETDLLLYFNFENNTGDYVIDLTINEHYGMLINMDPINDWVSGVYTCETNCTIEMSQTITLSPASPSSGSININLCEGSIYTTPLGANISSDSTLIETLSNFNGCDSILTINVNVIDSVYASNVFLCEGETYTSPQGIVATTDTTIIESYVSASGCDSVITINVTAVAKPNLTINHPGGNICNTNNGLELSTTPPNATFIGNAVVNGIFYASNLPLGNTTLIASYTSNEGCVNTDTLVFNVLDCSDSDDLFACYNLNGNAEDLISGLNADLIGNISSDIGHNNDADGAITLAGGTNVVASVNNINTNTIVDESIADGLTISAWIKPSVFMNNASGAIVSKWNNSLSGDQFILLFEGAQSGKILWAVGNGSTTANGIISSAIGVNSSTWSHIAATWEPGGLHKIYINGQLNTSATLSAFSSIKLNGNASLNIGAQNATFRNFNGSIDDVRIYGKAINETEILALYQNSPSCPNVTGIESSLKSSVSVYPNPSGKSITFEFGSDKGTVTFYSLDGMQVLKTDVSNNQSLNIENLSSGLYLLNVKTDTNTETIKFIKQ